MNTKFIKAIKEVNIIVFHILFFIQLICLFDKNRIINFFLIVSSSSSYKCSIIFSLNDYKLTKIIEMKIFMCMSHPINKAIKKGFINLERTQFKFMRINDNSEKSSSLSVSILNFFLQKMLST